MAVNYFTRYGSLGAASFFLLERFGQIVDDVAYSKNGLKFKKVASTVTIPAGKAYLDIEANSDALDIDFDGEATGVNGVAEAKAEVAPVKVIKNVSIR